MDIFQGASDSKSRSFLGLDRVPAGNFVTDWFETMVVGQLRGTGCESDDQIHFRAKPDRIASFRSWRQNTQCAVRTDFDVHKDVERRRDGIGCYAKRLEVAA